MNIPIPNGHKVLFLSHGGGPLPILGDAGHKEMVDNLKLITAKIEKPTAILVISAHWEENLPTIIHGARPSLIYDYYGFPEQAYRIQYPAPGEPGLAQEVFSVLNDNGVEARLEDQRGFDHGLYIPLKIMYPEADIPCIQLSLVDSLDPQVHINMGEALSQLKREGLLILGSGFSFHNMRAFFERDSNESKTKNESFEKWLIDTCSNQAIDEVERIHRLVNWENAPYARYCHPREEHLLPLHVCYGVAKRACSEFFELNILNKKASVYLWC
ncbi:MAG: extradiol ring-cleavage dioxygenase [Gammaproteobacteria bacterium SG8_11]|nr:MAG: extradiol ring-cleavage dioxygenase [Gammaproteobacteria bacterium SG8_11]